MREARFMTESPYNYGSTVFFNLKANGHSAVASPSADSGRVSQNAYFNIDFQRGENT